MAVFDVFKQWAGKVLDKAQPSEEKILDELYQDQITPDSPREELFKQNILMGDTTRSDRVGEEVVSEETAAQVDENLRPREVQSDSTITSKEDQGNIPEFLKLNRNTNSNNRPESINNAQSFSNDTTA
ncbi:MAG: hypothetical protein ACR2PU_02850, partial [Gammaproteobacteria bacterium]